MTIQMAVPDYREEEGFKTFWEDSTSTAAFSADRRYRYALLYVPKTQKLRAIEVAA